MVIDRILTYKPHMLKHIRNRYIIAVALLALFVLILISQPQP